MLHICASVYGNNMLELDNRDKKHQKIFDSMITSNEYSLLSTIL